MENETLNVSIAQSFEEVFSSVGVFDGGRGGGGGGDGGVSAFAKVVLIVLYSTVVVLSVGGNCLVIVSVLATEQMRTITNYFIVNMACADIMMAVLCIPFTFVANVLIMHWPFGSVLCPLVTYGQAVAVFLSAFTLIAISVDRHRAIRFPLRPRLTCGQLTGVIAVIWAVAVVLPLPVAIVSRVNLRKDLGGNWRGVCEEVWPSSRLRSIYTILIMVWQYFLPVSVLTFTYASISYAIWWKQTPGEPESARDHRMAASKKKMVKMMVYVVVIYALCWLPLHTVTLVGDTDITIWSFKYIQVTWIGAHWLAMSNCCCNPIVYYWMSSNFRNGYRTALTACCPPLCMSSRGGSASNSISHSRRLYYTPPPIRGQAVLSRGATVDSSTTATLAHSESERRFADTRNF